VSGRAVPARQWIANALEVLESVRHAMEDFHNAPTESRAKQPSATSWNRDVPSHGPSNT
jgi:hypothetical protein